jgi:hypothetical protein
MKQALNSWTHLVWKRWTKDNPLNLNESLLVMRAYAPYHHLYAIFNCFVILNKMPQDNVPSPSITFSKAERSNLLDRLVDIADSCLNSSLEAAANEPLPNNRVFSPQNRIKTKNCLADIRKAINLHFTMLPSMPGEKEFLQNLKIEL